MKRVDVLSVIREMREQIVKAMQERGIKELATVMSYKEWGKEQKYADEDYEHDENDDVDYLDYKIQEAPYVIFFDKYCSGHDVSVHKVKLGTAFGGPMLNFDCYEPGLGFIDTLDENDVAFLTLYNVYDALLDLLETE